MLGHDILSHSLLGMVKAFVALAYLPSVFDKIIDTTKSVVIVIWPLISTMKHQTPSLIDIDNGTISYIVQRFLHSIHTNAC